MLKVVHDTETVNENTTRGSLLDAMARDGAQKMLAVALRAEIDAYIEAHRGEVDENGHRLVVRNGYHERQVTTAAGAVAVHQPRVNDKRIDEAGKRRRFASSILPAWARKSPQVAEVLPLLYLQDLSSGNPIESTFATVKLRQRVTKGPGSRAAAIAFKQIESAHNRWRAVNALHLVALVRAGARFEKGKLVPRPDESVS